MIDYSDGKWHGWNGDWEIPSGIHGLSEIKYIWHDEDNGDIGHYHVDADTVAWSQVLKFRVTNVYIEPPKPREVWMKLDNYGIYQEYEKGSSGAILFREVL